MPKPSGSTGSIALARRSIASTEASGEVETWRLPTDTIGSLAVREKGGLILAMDQGFYAFDPDRERLDLIAEPLAGRKGIRFNDGKVDPNGRFIAGGMNISHEDHDHLSRIPPESGPVRSRRSWRASTSSTVPASTRPGTSSISQGAGKI